MLLFKDYYFEAEEYKTRTSALTNWVTNHPTFHYYLSHLPEAQKEEAVNNLVNSLHASFAHNVDFGDPSRIDPEIIRNINMAISKATPLEFRSKPVNVNKIPEYPNNQSVAPDGPVLLSTTPLQGRKIPDNHLNNFGGSGGKISLDTLALQNRKIPDTYINNFVAGGPKKTDLESEKYLGKQDFPGHNYDRSASSIEPETPPKLKEPLLNRIGMSLKRANRISPKKPLKNRVHDTLKKLSGLDPNFLPPGEHPLDAAIEKRNSAKNAGDAVGDVGN